jgi:hypothetical protein
VSEGVVSLYTAAGRHSSPPDWTLRFSGVPVLLLDLGGSRSRGRGVRLVLAERDSGLALWYDTLDNLSSYEAQACIFFLNFFFVKFNKKKTQTHKKIFFLIYYKKFLALYSIEHEAFEYCM